MGDHEFFSNTLKLPHWQSHNPCWECNALGKARAEAKGKPGMCFATLEKGKQEFTVAPNSEAGRKAALRIRKCRSHNALGGGLRRLRGRREEAAR